MHTSLPFTTINEGPLHRDLKFWYATPGDLMECQVDGFTVDICRDNLLIEIQTAGFGSLKKKLAILTRSHRVRLVYPLPTLRYILKESAPGDLRPIRRKSPLKPNRFRVFSELVHIARIMRSPNLSLEILHTEEEEMRWKGTGGWRAHRRGYATRERRLIRILESDLYDPASDIGDLLSPSLPEQFGTADIAAQCRVRVALARQAAYTLRKADILEIAGKRGNALLYRRAPRVTGS